MCDILLINSPLFKVKQNNEDNLPPIGLGYIASNLQQNSIDVELIDAVYRNLSIDEINQIIKEKAPKYVGINIFSTNYEVVKEIIETCYTSVGFIIGGQVTRYIYRDVIEWSSENKITIVIGEGDYIIRDIVLNKILVQPLLSQANRIVYEVNSDSIYFPKEISDIPLNRSFFENEPIKNPFNLSEVSIITSRGCIYNCAFCGAARSLNQNITVRERSKESIINEIYNLKLRYPKIKSVRILDDLFLKNVGNIKMAIDIFKTICIKWRAMAHVMSFKEVSDNTLIELKQSGCTELFIGIESGSEKILKKIKKTNDVYVIKRTVLRLLFSGINVKGYFIFGFPDECEDDFKNTFNLANELKQISLKTKGNFRVSVFEYRPYHGTELYNFIRADLKKIDSIKPNQDLSDKIGRSQFNFHSGNFSKCNDEVLNNYILMTNGLNSLKE